MQSEFYINHSGQELGPYIIEDILSQLRIGRITLEDYIYLENQNEWVPLSEFPLVSTRFKLEMKQDSNVTVNKKNQLDEITNDTTDQVTLDLIDLDKDHSEVDFIFEKNKISERNFPPHPEFHSDEIPMIALNSDLQEKSEPSLGSQDVISKEPEKSPIESLFINVAQQNENKYLNEKNKFDGADNEKEIKDENPEKLGQDFEDHSLKLKGETPLPTDHPNQQSTPQIAAQEIEIMEGEGVFELTSQEAEKIEIILVDIESNDVNIDSREEIEFVAGEATQFKLSALSQVTAGETFKVEVRALDSYGNLDEFFNSTVTIIATGSTLGTGVIRLRRGMGSLDLSDQVAETIKLSLIDNEKIGIDSTHTLQMNICPGPPSRFVVKPIPDSIAGQTCEVQIEVHDLFGNLNIAFGCRVKVELSGQAKGADVISINHGIGRLNVINQVSERVVVKLIDIDNTKLDISSVQHINFHPGQATQISFSVFPNIIVAGVSEGLTLEAQDSYGNIDTNFNHKIGIRIVGIFSSYMTIELSNGVGRTEVSSRLAGYCEVSLEDVHHTNLKLPETKKMQIISGDPTQFIILPFNEAVAGKPISGEVQVQDVLGNIVENYEGNVTLHSTGSVRGGGLLAIAKGRVFFELTNDVSEEVEVRLEDSSKTGFKVISKQIICFHSGKASKIIILSQDSSIAGVKILVRIQAQDRLGNWDKSFEGKIKLNSSGQCEGVGEISIINGEGFKELINNKAETVILSIQDINTKLDVTSEKKIVFYPAPAMKYIIVGPPTMCAGEKTSIKIEAHDEFGNMDSSFNGAATLRASGTCKGEGVVKIISGVGVTEIEDTIAGEVSLTLEDTVDSGLDVSCAHKVVVKAGPAKKIVILKTLKAEAGKPVKVVVQAHDQFGNIAMDFNSKIKLKTSKVS